MLLRLFNFIYFQCIISMGLPSAPVPPRRSCCGNRRRAGCCCRLRQGRDVSGQPALPRDGLSTLSSAAKRNSGERKDLSDTAKRSRSRKAARMRREPATTS